MSNQSVILQSCQNYLIHGSHMQIIRLSNPLDPGYKAVSNTLWVWIDEIENTRALFLV